MADVLILQAADDEYVAALRWYAERSIAAAIGFEAAVACAIDSITVHPSWAPVCDERHRFMIVRGYPFQVIYRIDGPASIVVVAIAHGSREPDYWRHR
jgi:plasmid stabilization system protein ParE